MDLVVVGESAGEFPDALLGTALLVGVHGVIDERDAHGMRCSPVVISELT
jgi:hypothetical protein